LIVDIGALGQGDLYMLVSILASAYKRKCPGQVMKFPFEIALTKVDTSGKPAHA